MAWNEMEPRKGAQGHLIGDTAVGDPKCDWGQCRLPYVCAEENIFELHTKPGWPQCRSVYDYMCVYTDACVHICVCMEV